MSKALGDEDDDEEAKFDVIYDYTVSSSHPQMHTHFLLTNDGLTTTQFLCALHPSLRQQWAARMSDLLPSGGLLVCLEFPMYKDPTLPGPPWGLKGVHWDLLSRGGDGIANIVGIESESMGGGGGTGGGQFERILYVKPRRSYEQGKGMDMLSVCVRK